MKVYCPECETACSEQAPFCPQCGHPLQEPQQFPTPPPTKIVYAYPPKTKSSFGGVIKLFVALVFGGSLLMCLGICTPVEDTPHQSSAFPYPGGPTPIVARTKPKVAKPKFKKDAKTQAERKKLIEGLIAEGVFWKVDKMGGSLPKVYVTPLFYSLRIDAKQSFVSVIYAYYFDGSSLGDHVILRDSRTGKDVGSFTAWGGLKMK